MANRTGLRGDRELVAALTELSREGITGVEVDQAAVEALEPMKLDTQAAYKTHRQTKSNPHFAAWGKLTKNGQHLDQLIKVRKISGNRAVRKYRLGATGRARRVAHLLEFGTAPHWQPKRKMFHPGARAHPGMAPAFEAHRHEIEPRMAKAIWARLQAKIARLARKGVVRKL